jgi:hypothetical protein
MSARKLLLLLALAVSALVLSSCDGDDDVGGAESPTPAVGATATPAEKDRTVTSDDGNLTLEIPPGAVAEETDITITAVPLDELPDELQVVRGAGDGYRLEPDGLEFSEPVAVSLELDRGELEGQPQDGITAYGLVILTGDGDRQLLDELVTEASLGDATVMVRGELRRSGWLGRTAASLTVTLEEPQLEGPQREQPDGGAFTARATAKNTDPSGTVTLGPTLGTFIAGGATSVQDNPYFFRHATFGPPEEIESNGTFECGESAGAGTYGVRVVTTSRVAVEGGDAISTQLTVVLNGEVECA